MNYDQNEPLVGPRDDSDPGEQMQDGYVPPIMEQPLMQDPNTAAVMVDENGNILTDAMGQPILAPQQASLDLERKLTQVTKVVIPRRR